MSYVPCDCETTAHDAGCPNAPGGYGGTKVPRPSRQLSPSQKGWKCGECGRVNAPWRAECPCFNGGYTQTI